MSHYQDERNAIEALIRAVLRDEDIPLVLENDPTPIAKGVAYISCAILAGDGSFASISSAPRRRYTGLVSVRIFVKERTGNQEGDRLLELTESAFVNPDTGTPLQVASGSNGLITFELPSPIPAETVAGFFCKGLRVPYYRDQQGANH